MTFDREESAFTIIEKHPGVTIPEIHKRMPQYTREQIISVVYTALYQTKGFIRADTKSMPIRWYTID